MLSFVDWENMQILLPSRSKSERHDHILPTLWGHVLGSTNDRPDNLRVYWAIDSKWAEQLDWKEHEWIGRQWRDVLDRAQFNGDDDRVEEVDLTWSCNFYQNFLIFNNSYISDTGRSKALRWFYAFGRVQFNRGTGRPVKQLVSRLYEVELLKSATKYSDN